MSVIKLHLPANVLEHELIQAAETGNLDKIKMLQHQGVMLSTRQNQAFHTAIKANQLNVVDYLYHNIQIDTNDMALALMAACQAGHYFIFKFLIKKNPETALYPHLKAAISGDYLAIVKHFYRQNNKPENVYHKAMKYAAKHGSLKTFDYLASNVTNINLILEVCFLKAATNGHLSLVKTLTAFQINIHCENEMPIRMAAINGHTDIVYFLDSQGARIRINHDHADDFYVMVKKSNAEILNYLYASGLNIRQDKDKAILIAAETGNLDTFRFLYQRGCNNRKAIKRALLNGDTSIIEYYFGFGKNGKRDIYYLIRAKHLQHIIEQGHNNMLQFLHEKSEYFSDVKDTIHLIYGLNCDSVLKNVVSKGHFGIIKFFDTNRHHYPLFLKNLESFSIFKIAVENGHLELVNFLYQNYQIFRENASVLYEIAARHGHLSIVKFFYQKGVEIRLIDFFLYSDLRPEVKEYIEKKDWLHNTISVLKRLAAKTYVKHYAELPPVYLVPDHVLRILEIAAS